MMHPLSGNSFPIVTSHRLAGSKGGWSSLPVTIDVKAKVYSRYDRDIVCSERWQRQLQQQSHVPSEDTMSSMNMDASCGRKKATVVREPGNEHDQFAVAVLEDETLCTVGHLPREIQDSFYMRFLIMHHIPNVLLHCLCCLNFYSCVTLNK